MPQPPLPWPPEWPAGVPPDDAVDGNGTYYRLARHSPLSVEDFLTPYESRTWKKRAEIDRLSLSILITEEDAVQTRKLYEKLGNYIAKGVLGSGCGKTKLTPGAVPTHTDWWPFEQPAVRQLRFELVERLSL